MRVMVAGATGAIGTRLVPLMVAAGHTVTAPYALRLKDRGVDARRRRGRRRRRA